MIGLIFLITGIILYTIGQNKLKDDREAYTVKGKIVGWTTAPGAAPINHTELRGGPNDFPVFEFTDPHSREVNELPSNHSMAAYRVNRKIYSSSPKLGDVFAIRYTPKNNSIYRPGGEKNIKHFGQGFIMIGIFLIIFEIIIKLLLSGN